MFIQYFCHPLFIPFLRKVFKYNSASHLYLLKKNRTFKVEIRWQKGQCDNALLKTGILSNKTFVSTVSFVDRLYYFFFHPGVLVCHFLSDGCV